MAPKSSRVSQARPGRSKRKASKESTSPTLLRQTAVNERSKPVRSTPSPKAPWSSPTASVRRNSSWRAPSASAYWSRWRSTWRQTWKSDDWRS